MGLPGRLSLKQIEYFRAVMEAGTVSGAARLLHVSQPSVSRMLKYTEGRLGVPLFEHRKGRLHPTPEARALFQEVQSLHAHLESLQEALGHIVRGEFGRFTVGSSPSLGRHVVPSLLSAVRVSYPVVPIKLDILSVSQVIDYVSLGQGEGACTIFPLSHPLIDTQALATGALLCAVPRGHRLANQRTISARELSNEALIGFEPDTPHGRVVRQFLGEGSSDPRFQLTVRFAESACALAEHGSGIALVDEFTLSGGAFPNLVRLRLNWRRPFRIYFHRATHRPLSVVGTRFLQLLTEWRPAGEEAALRPPGRGEGSDRPL